MFDMELESPDINKRSRSSPSSSSSAMSISLSHPIASTSSSKLPSPPSSREPIQFLKQRKPPKGEKDEQIDRDGKQPVRRKAVVYSLSPFQQKTMSGLWNDLPGKIHHKISENWIGASLLLVPLIGTYSYVQRYQEKEKLEHRY